MSTRNALFLSLALWISSSCALAFQPLITDDTGTQGKDGNQLEFSANQDRESVAGESTRTRTLPLVFTRGLSDSLDLYVAVVPTSIRSSAPGADASGSGNPALGAKWRFYENEESKTSLGFKPELRLPIAAGKEAAGLGTGRLSYGLLLILTQETSFGAIHANLAKGRDQFRSPAIGYDTSTGRASIAPVWNIGEQWKLAVDLGHETEWAHGKDKRFNFVEIGLVFSPSKEFDFAMGLIRRNGSGGSTIDSATLGITWHF